MSLLGKNKKVSIIMPAYNCSQYIGESISSIISQTYNNIELVITDDGSTDATLSIANSYAERYPDIIKVYTQNNKGPGYARNNSILKCTGDYVAYQDADDFSVVKRIEEEMRTLSNNPDCVMTYSGHIAIDNTKELEVPAVPFSKRLLLKENYIACGSVLHKKSILNVIGYWDENDDWDMWIRVAEKFNIVATNQTLYRYNRNVGISSAEGIIIDIKRNIRTFKGSFKRTMNVVSLIQIISYYYKLLKCYVKMSIKYVTQNLGLYPFIKRYKDK
jgi:teichuronic acid biosynthesis glycosyltransferase TuaG